MINLKKPSGLPIILKGDRLIFTKELLHHPVKKRSLKQAKEFLEVKTSSFKLPALYLMYRGVVKKTDVAIFKRHGKQYDITVIFPGLLGKEFDKTIGHSHIGPFPEAYEILEGEALFLFQKYQKKKTDQVFLVKAKKGQKVIVPPGFGHVSVNATRKILVLGNLWKSNVKSDYSLFHEKNGGAYYIEKAEVKSKIKITSNKNYGKVLPLKKARPKEIKKLGIDFQKPLYDSFIENPENFNFLTNPEKFSKDLSPDNLFIF